MRNTLLAAAAAFVVGGASIGSLMSHAQPAPPPPPGAEGGPGAGGPGPEMSGPGSQRPMEPMGWTHRWHHHHSMDQGPFALVYRQKDLNLSPPDVQTIIEGFLLRHGNHTWKVVNVGAAADGQIGFSLATQEGSVIATFTMDAHSGRVTRTG